jgi:hypothetical protein
VEWGGRRGARELWAAEVGLCTAAPCPGIQPTLNPRCGERGAGGAGAGRARLWGEKGRFVGTHRALYYYLYFAGATPRALASDQHGACMGIAPPPPKKKQLQHPCSHSRSPGTPLPSPPPPRRYTLRTGCAGHCAEAGDVWPGRANKLGIPEGARRGSRGNTRICRRPKQRRHGLHAVLGEGLGLGFGGTFKRGLKEQNFAGAVPP